MTYNNLLTEVSEAIALVRVNRPEKLNAYDRQTLLELEHCIAALETDAAVRAVILTGAGEKAFVAGADIACLAKLGAAGGREWARLGQRVFDGVERLSKPVIAAVNGYALGGGLELALACHLRIASETARFGLPEVKIGLIPGNGGTQRLPRLVGKGRALEMMLTGEPIPAGEAWRIGLVNHVVPAAELLAAARALAGKIVANAPVAIALCLEAVREGLEMPLPAALEWEASLSGLVMGTEDAHEGVRAFLEKRSPVFRGR
jgi:enoyl-CoA hydratase